MQSRTGSVPKIGPLVALALLAAPCVRAGQAVALDPGGAESGPAADEAALASAYRSAYGRRFSGYAAASRQPGTRDGAFVVFQKALILLMTDPERMRQALSQQDRSPWFDPGFPSTPLAPVGSGGTIVPSGYQIAGRGASGELRKIYAPSDEALERIAALAQDIAEAEARGDRGRLDQLQKDFLGVMQGEIRELGALMGGGEAIIGLGVRDTAGNLEPVRFDPGVLDRGVAVLSGDPPSPGPQPGLGSRRTMTSKATAYYDRVGEEMNRAMSNSERTKFELSLPAAGFELANPDDPQEGAVIYDLYQAMPIDVVGGGLNLDSRERRP